MSIFTSPNLTFFAKRLDTPVLEITVQKKSWSQKDLFKVLCKLYKHNF